MEAATARARVTIATTEGNIEVEAEVYGLWALTPRVEDGVPDMGHWAFTHIPTGRTYGGHAYANRAAVQEFVKMLGHEFSGEVWDTEDTAGIPEEERDRFKRAFSAWMDAEWT